MDIKLLATIYVGDKPLKLIDVRFPTHEDSIILEFTDFKFVKLSSYHDQVCVEKVYMDISDIVKEEFLALVGKEFKNILIYKVIGSGIRIICTTEEEYMYRGGNNVDRDSIMINCYNEQNGYYSDSLLLKIESTFPVYLDITDSKKDEIC